MAKAKAVKQALDVNRMSAAWTLPSRLGDDPLVWTIRVDGLVVDVRSMPREVQEIAPAIGLIPFIPEDHDE